MFSLISGFKNWYFTVPTYRILIIGDEGAGKTVDITSSNTLDLF